MESMVIRPLINYLLGLLLAPLLLGIINRVKAWVAGRRGQPLLQAYYDLFKLFRKGSVYSKTTTLLFRLGPIVGLAAALMALAAVPLRGGPALLAFPGDIFFVAGWLGLMRFATILAALDTGSSFEGMGASREAQFATLAEPALLLGLAVMAAKTGGISLSHIFPESLLVWPELLLVVAALAIVFLCENSRIPFDDPNTHLELTMIHEVMVLDHSGVDLAFILYGASLKIWVLGLVIVGLILPLGASDPWWLVVLLSMLGMMILAALVGLVESTMARLRLTSVPKLLFAAIALSAVALILASR